MCVVRGTKMSTIQKNNRTYNLARERERKRVRENGASIIQRPETKRAQLRDIGSSYKRYNRDNFNEWRSGNLLVSVTVSDAPTLSSPFHLNEMRWVKILHRQQFLISWMLTAYWINSIELKRSNAVTTYEIMDGSDDSAFHHWKLDSFAVASHWYVIRATSNTALPLKNVTESSGFIQISKWMCQFSGHRQSQVNSCLFHVRPDYSLFFCCIILLSVWFVHPEN